MGVTVGRASDQQIVRDQQEGGVHSDNLCRMGAQMPVCSKEKRCLASLDHCRNSVSQQSTHMSGPEDA